MPYSVILNAEAMRQLACNELEEMLWVREVGGDNRGEMVSRFLAAVGIKTPAPWCAALQHQVNGKVARAVSVLGAERMESALYPSASVKETWENSNPLLRRHHPAAGLLAVWIDPATGKGHMGRCMGGYLPGPKLEFETIEGNTRGDVGFDRNGDRIARKTRSPVKYGTLVFMGYLDPWGHLE